jgi:hypothetical protein
LTLAALSASAGSLPRVVVLPSDQSPVVPAFVEALRIQVVNRAEVVVGPPLRSHSLGDRLPEASRLVGDGHAALAIWIEESSSQEPSVREFVVYAVGKQEHRALIEVARIRADEAPDTMRALALKVGAFIDTVLATKGGAPELGRGLEAERPPGAEVAPAPLESRSRLRFVAEVGAQGAISTSSSGAQGGLGVAAGARLDRGEQLFELYGGLGLFGDLHIDGAAGALTVREKRVVGGARALFVPGRLPPRLAFGALVEGGARLLTADGVSPSGGRGSVDRAVPVLAFGGEARLLLGASAALRASLGLEVEATRQTFGIDGVAAADLGRLRPIGAISLIFSVP